MNELQAACQRQRAKRSSKSRSTHVRGSVPLGRLGRSLDWQRVELPQQVVDLPRFPAVTDGEHSFQQLSSLSADAGRDIGP